MNSSTTSELPSVQHVASNAVFRDFVDWLKRNKAKLRAGCKMTVDTRTFKTASLPTIEIKVADFSSKWMPLKVPDGRWHFKDVEERDAILSEIKKSLNPQAEARREKP